MPDKVQNFTHLHVHTEYSLLDGACRIEAAAQRAKAMGQTALAITDHGVMYGCVDFYRACKIAGIKPIIGCEVYVAPRSRTDRVHKVDSANNHLVLLCKNETGYRNLLKLVSAAFVEGFYSKPRVDHELLEKYHEGLIALSACLAGEIPRALLAGDNDRAKETALFYKNTFGPGNYYIELQDHGIEDQKTVLPRLISLARQLDIPLVATNDAHYIEKADAKTQHILICIQTGKTVNDEDTLEFETEEFYLKSTEEMFDLFSYVPEACENTNKIADECNFDFEFGVTKLPYFKAPPPYESNRAFFDALCLAGLHKHYGENPPAHVVERLSYETDIIDRMGYLNYYLIVHDFIDYAKRHDIPVGPGRGSGAGSLAAYCMGITGVDPLRYQLLFERFLNPERVTMPDFDIDFCYEKRQRVIDYVIEKYGADHVAQIITFGTMAARAAIRDVGRVLGMPYQDVDRVAKLVPQELKMTLSRALDVAADLCALYNADAKVKELIDIAIQVEGTPRHASTHAAGVVITPEPVDNYVPLQSNDGQIVTQFTMTTIEELGLLKMDFLGLRTLTVLADSERAVQKTNPAFRLEDIPYDDPEIFAMLTRGDVTGVFQFESSGMRQVIMGLHPVSVEDLIAVISLYRPGPMDSIPTYLHNRHNPEDIRYKTPQLAHILDVTNGCIVYQEQVMQICRELAGFSYGQADLVRRAMSKKKHDVMEQERKNFVFGSADPAHPCVGCVANGIPEKVANEIFDEMSSFASYAFNKSHAAAYAVVAYQTAYFRCHYEKEFFAALLTSVLDNTDKIIEYSGECQREGITVLPPSVNKSAVGFEVEGDSIRFGLQALKNVGRGLIETVIARRQQGPYRSMYDFCERMHGTELNRRAVESFIKSGAFDEFGANRRQMLSALEGLLKSVENSARRKIDGQLDLFGENAGADEYPLPDEPDFTPTELLNLEKEVSGLYLSGHPLDAYRETAKVLGSVKTTDLNSEGASDKYDGKMVAMLCTVVKTRVLTTKSNTQMAFCTVEDLSGTIELLLFSRVLEQCRFALQENAVISVKGRVSYKEDEGAKIVAEQVIPVAEYQEKGFPAYFDSRRSDRSEDSRAGRPEDNQQTPTKGKTDRSGLYVKVQGRDSDEMKKVLDFANIFDGETPLYIYFEDTNQLTLAPRQYWVQQTPVLLNELKALLGEGRVATR